MCEHLKVLEYELENKGIVKTFEGKAWSENCNVWTYYDCFIDAINLKARLKLPQFVVVHTNDDPRSGLEYGLVCDICKDAIIGVHLSNSQHKIHFL